MATALKITLMLLTVVPFGKAQVMSPTEYTDFLHKLDADAMKWQKQIRSLSVEGLPVSYADGKIIKIEQDGTIQMIDQIHRLIGEELVQARLSTKLKIVDRINDAFLETSLLDLSAFRLAPDATEHWRKEVSAQIEVIDVEKGQLMDHTIATADELQNEAEKCKP